MIRHSKHFGEIQHVLLDGIALGGFNLVDCVALVEELTIPVITVSIKQPNFTAIRDAIEQHFADAVDRLCLLDTLGVPRELQINIDAGVTSIFYQTFGISGTAQKNCYDYSANVQRFPTLRLAHLIASLLA